MERILAGLMLAMAGLTSSRSRCAIIPPQYMEDIARFEFGSSVRQTILVYKKRKINPGLFSEEARVICISRANSGERCTRIFEFSFVLAQLRDVLPAEDSAVVTKEDQHSGASFPE